MGKSFIRWSREFGVIDLGDAGDPYPRPTHTAERGGFHGQ